MTRRAITPGEHAVPVVVRLPHETVEWLHEQARECQCSVAELVRVAVLAAVADAQLRQKAADYEPMAVDSTP